MGQVVTGCGWAGTNSFTRPRPAEVTTVPGHPLNVARQVDQARGPADGDAGGRDVDVRGVERRAGDHRAVRGQHPRRPDIELAGPQRLLSPDGAMSAMTIAAGRASPGLKNITNTAGSSCFLASASSGRCHDTVTFVWRPPT
jgi:hypothetical protein